MKEYYLDFKNQKRRLKFYHGDMIICSPIDERGLHIVYRVVKHTGCSDKWSLYCESCCRIVGTMNTKEDMKNVLLKHMNVRKVIKKHDVVRMLEKETGIKMIKD